ncbi:group 3 secretory phospholipase A2 [Diretmus argenteus]
MAEANVLCAWIKVMSNEEAHYTFLRRASPSPRLYHTVWSAERTLLNCAYSDDATVIRGYLSMCRERTGNFSDHQDEHFNIAPVFAKEELCVAVASPRVSRRGERTGGRPGRSVGLPSENGQGQRSSGVESHRRVKRGFIVPGTLWCGSGNKAPSYSDLGTFAETDSCCREHDQCKDTILSFQSNFGVFNSNIFTMSHCDCDNRFRTCLEEANDSISDVVGYTFFNLLKMHCFEFSHTLQCVERNWFGMCKQTEMALYAEVYPPTLFKSDEPAEESVSHHTSVMDTVISTQADQLTTEAQESSTSDPGLLSILRAAPPTASALSPASTSASVTATADSNLNTPETVTASPSEGSRDLENALPAEDLHSSAHTPKPSPSSGPTLPEQDTANADMQLSCGVYKDLDQCRARILPQHKRYGLHNPEPRTLYHCNCTARLFQSLSEQRELTEVQTLLLGHVSQSCFLAQDCTVGKNCAAVVVRPDLLQLEQRGGVVTEEWRHLQAMTLKVRRPNSNRAKAKSRAARLHRLCLRLTLPKLHPKLHRHAAEEIEVV